MRSSILFLVFNRPDTTSKVFATIRAAKPPRLYVAADGPRKDREGEWQRCQQVRKIVNEVDWPCEVFTLFRDENLGCKKAVSQAISWFFEQEEEGIILEDDILALPSFFLYCDELLAYYRNNSQVGMISGGNFIESYLPLNTSYFFSKYSHIWGWATWRRVWQYYDVAMQDWPNWKQQGKLKVLTDNNIFFEKYWETQFDLVYQNKIDTWDYQWTFLCWKMGFLSIIPKTDLVMNIGFNSDATHTTEEVPNYVSNAVPKDLTFPLVHPSEISRNIQADKLINKLVFNLTLKHKLNQKFSNAWYKLWSK